MALAALIVSVLALLISSASVVYIRRQSHAAVREADAAQASERRERQPRLVVELTNKIGARDDVAIYGVRNDGPQDLDSVQVHRPTPGDGITYPIARTGTEWSDEADLGALLLTQQERFTLSVGAAAKLPEFRVLIDCRAGTDRWTVPVLLEEPRKPVATIAAPARGALRRPGRPGRPGT